MKYRMRTVQINDRGQVVIPEEVRNDLGLRAGQALVLLEIGDELILKKESAVVKELVSAEDEKRFWRALTAKAMETAWDEQDEAWDAFAPQR